MTPHELWSDICFRPLHTSRLCWWCISAPSALFSSLSTEVKALFISFISPFRVNPGLVVEEAPYALGWYGALDTEVYVVCNHSITLLMSTQCGLQRAFQSRVSKQSLSCSFASSVHTFTVFLCGVSVPTGCMWGSRWTNLWSKHPMGGGFLSCMHPWCLHIASAEFVMPFVWQSRYCVKLGRVADSKEWLHSPETVKRSMSLLQSCSFMVMWTELHHLLFRKTLRSPSSYILQGEEVAWQ